MTRASRIAAIATALSLGCAFAYPAAAQTGEPGVVMRRPLPQSYRVGPGPETPTPTPSPTSLPDGEVTDEPVTNDPTELCDGSPGSPQPLLTNVAWVLEGYATTPGTNGSCDSKKPVYVCQATFACQVNGRNDAFTSVAPDSMCENYDGEVTYPSGTGGGGGELPPICPFPLILDDGFCRLPLELPPAM